MAAKTPKTPKGQEQAVSAAVNPLATGQGDDVRDYQRVGSAAIEQRHGAAALSAALERRSVLSLAQTDLAASQTAQPHRRELPGGKPVDADGLMAVGTL